MGGIIAAFFSKLLVGLFGQWFGEEKKAQAQTQAGASQQAVSTEQQSDAVIDKAIAARDATARVDADPGKLRAAEQTDPYNRDNAP